MLTNPNSKVLSMISFNEACELAVKIANKSDGDLEMARIILECLGYKGSTYGIEYVECADRKLRYLNTGDTYSLTIAQEDNGGSSGWVEDWGELFVTSWGDWYENAEKEYCEENNAIRCGYCGEFTDCAEKWEETICNHCGNNVAG